MAYCLFASFVDLRLPPELSLPRFPTFSSFFFLFAAGHVVMRSYQVSAGKERESLPPVLVNHEVSS